MRIKKVEIEREVLEKILQLFLNIPLPFSQSAPLVDAMTRALQEKEDA